MHKALILYRNILREHRRRLPNQMRKLGDDYVKHEFKLHKGVTIEAHSAKFFNGWNEYLTMLLSKGKLGKNLDTVQKKVLNEEQHEKLQQLREESRFNEATINGNNNTKENTQS